MEANQFRDVLLAAGLTPPLYIQPGKFLRFPGIGKNRGNTAGWCRLFDDSTGGVYGDYSNDFKGIWQAQRETVYTTEDREIFGRKVEVTKKQAEAARQDKADKASLQSGVIWKSAKPCVNHPYLTKKMVSPFLAKLISGSDPACDGWFWTTNTEGQYERLSGSLLLLPLYHSEGQIRGLQAINEDGRKSLIKGMGKFGLFIPLTDKRLTAQYTGKIIISEGFATACTIYEATGFPIMAAIDAGNLINVARVWREKCPTSQIVIAGDFDKSETGQKKAIEAANAVSGFIALPPFTKAELLVDEPPTDWNDFADLHGIDAVKSAISAISARLADYDGLDSLSPQNLVNVDSGEIESESASIPAVSDKPTIKVVEGGLDLIVDEAELALATQGGYYQAGGLIVTVSIEPVFGDPSITPISGPALTRVLAENIQWVKFSPRIKDFVPTDPPPRHCSILHDSQKFKYLPTLLGLARQPYFRQIDCMLINKAGYDQQSKMFGAFDPSKFHIPDATMKEALDALDLLEDLLKEFHFVTAADKAAAISAIFTAVVRPSLAHAPAFHVRAPVFGSGKSYLCEVIGAFAGPGRNAKVSYPTSAEEATKVILSLLLTNPAVVEFDDMSSDWIPHGTILRMLTAELITDRILGVSKTATVSTRTLFLGSGNNVGPVRDLLRRVLTINIDPRCATPATMKYRGDPLATVLQNRETYVAAVLTIIEAWRKAGCSRSAVQSIVTYGGDWSDYCRHPLIWLGLPDPASLLIDQIAHDPDADSLEVLMNEWRAAFGSTPTTVRKAVDAAEYGNSNLLDAMMELPIEERGGINRSKLGWLIKKNANRIIAGYEFQQCTADGRPAWRVVSVSSPPLPPLPTSIQPSDETISKLSNLVEVEI